MKIRLSLIVVLMCALLGNVSAQRYNIAIGPELNIPSGNTANISAIGYGGGVKAEIRLSNKFSLTANGSVDSFIGKTYFGARTQTITSIPVKLGLKYYKASDFYFEGQVGGAFPLNTNNAKESLAWSLGLGTYTKRKNSANQLDFGLRYEAWTNSRVFDTTVTNNFASFNFIAIRVAYAFSL